MSCIEALEAYEINGKRLEIYHDDCDVSPRDWDNLGIMACKHPDYNLGDVQIDCLDCIKCGNDDRYCKCKKYTPEFLRDAVYVMPIELYDHGEIMIFPMGGCEIDRQWDVSQIGYMYTTKERIRAMYGNKTIHKPEIKKAFLEEIKVYNQYLAGDVYAYSITNNGQTVDSMGGFYGLDYAKEAICEEHEIWKKVLE